MSTSNQQGNDSRGGIVAAISVLSLFLMLALAIISIIYRVSGTIIPFLGLAVESFGSLCAFLDIAPKARQALEQRFKTFPSTQVLLVLAVSCLIINTILVSAILLPIIRGDSGKANIQHASIIVSSPTSSVSSTATAATLATAKAQATTMAIYSQITSGKPTIADSLSGQDNLEWDSYNESSGSCQFNNKAYYAEAKPPNNSTSCETTTTNFADLAIQAEVTIISGDNGGIIFRSNQNEDSFYTFYITTEGTYYLVKSSPSSDVQSYATLNTGSSSSIKPGTNQTNTLTIIARRTNFNFYVNMHYVGSLSDDSYKAGAVGVFTISENGNLDEAKFNDLKVWSL